MLTAAPITVRASELPEVVALYAAAHRVLAERLLHGEPSIQAWNDLIEAHDVLCEDTAERSSEDAA